MRVFAFCCKSFVESTRKAAGVEPLLSPPFSARSVNPGLLEGRDFIYLDLHGGPGVDCWFGDDGLVALTAEQVRGVDLGGAVVFAANCYLGDDDSPMMDALLDAGASFVIGGRGPNYAGTGRVYGAALLGQWVRRLIGLGFGPLKALGLAKLRVARRWERKAERKADKDALEFRAYKRKKGQGDKGTREGS